MSTAQRSYKLTRSRKDVKQILTDLRMYGKFHPLIVDVRQLGPCHAGFTDFKIIEKPWPALPFSIRYAVRVQSDDQRIRYQIAGIPLHQIEFHYRLVEVNRGLTTVHLLIQIKGVPVLQHVLLLKMLRAQSQFMSAVSA